MATFAKGKGYSKSDLCDDGNPIILYGRLYTKYETVISEVDTFAEAKDGSVYSVGGEVIVPASGETAEEISIASVVANSGVLLGGDLNVISPSDSLDPAFLAISITYGNPHNEMAKLAQGKTVVHLHNDDLKKIDLLFPTLEEQRRIRDVFYDIDNIITLHQRKCDELKIYKKGLLQQMFPQPGEAFPHVRFPGFTDPWEQRKFGDIGSVSMCKRIFKEETTTEGEIPFYKIGTFGSSPDAFISRQLFEEYKAKFSYPKPGAILLSASGTIGRIVEYKGEEAYFQDSNIVWLSHDKSVSNKFLKVLYPTVKWDGIEGSTIQRLYNDNFLKTGFKMPGLPEQEKIGEFFEGIDNLITLHQRDYLQ